MGTELIQEENMRKGEVKASDASYMHIPVHIIGVSIEMLAKNLRHQASEYNVCVSVTQLKWSFWLNRTRRLFRKRRD